MQNSASEQSHFCLSLLVNAVPSHVSLIITHQVQVFSNVTSLINSGREGGSVSPVWPVEHERSLSSLEHERSSVFTSLEEKSPVWTFTPGKQVQDHYYN